MSAAISKPEVAKSGKLAFGPCGDCAFYLGNETRAQHATGKCHGAPPTPMGWPVVRAIDAGCAAFKAR